MRTVAFFSYLCVISYRTNKYNVTKKGGASMAKSGPEPTYTFTNPNDPKAFELMLKRILVNKLLSLYADYFK